MTLSLSEVPPTMRLYTVTEAMALLKMSRSAIYEELRSGRLGSVNRGRSRRIPGTDIVDYIELLKREAEAA